MVRDCPQLSAVCSNSQFLVFQKRSIERIFSVGTLVWIVLEHLFMINSIANFLNIRCCLYLGSGCPQLSAILDLDFARNPLSKSEQTTSHALNSLSAASEPPGMSRLILEGHDQLQSFPRVRLQYSVVVLEKYPAFLPNFKNGLTCSLR